jgi:hypothetical protein
LSKEFDDIGSSLIVDNPSLLAMACKSSNDRDFRRSRICSGKSILGSIASTDMDRAGLTAMGALIVVTEDVEIRLVEPEDR